MDVCEIGLRILGVAEICAVKILGTLCLIDEGEADWKLISICADDPWAPFLNDVTDLEVLCDGSMLSTLRSYDCASNSENIMHTLCTVRRMSIESSVS